MRKLNLPKQKLTSDKNLLGLIMAFVFIGLVGIADASAPQALNMFGDKFYLFKQQLTWALVGFVVLFVTSKIHYSFWEKLANSLFFASIFFLIIVLLPNLGFKALGARRWIDFGFINFQPSELVKFSLSIYLAKVASKNKEYMAFLVPVILITGLIMLQPDLGTTLIIAVISFGQIFISNINLVHYGLSVLGGIIGTVLLILVSPYRRDRLSTFLQMETDPLGSSYHIRQVLLGLGSGGLFGVGLGESRQKYLFLPEASTDSIFAIIAEELGFIGAVAIIALYTLFIFKGMSIAQRAPDTFSKVLAVGITLWIGGQAFLNIASMVALVPLTGIPLPFISYGGSSLVTVMAASGILLNISKYSTIQSKHSR